jgi:hypothetical protein
MNEQWRQQLREKMADYRRPAPEVSWNEIDKVLDARKARKTRLLWQSMAAAAVLLLIASVGYWSFRHDEEITDSTMIMVADGQQQPREQPDAIKVSSVPHITAKLVEELQPVATEVTDISVNTDTVESSTPTDEVQPRATDKQVPPTARRSHVIYPSDFHQRKHLGNRLTAKVYLSNTMNDSYHAESSIKQITNTTINSKTIVIDPNDTDKASNSHDPNNTTPYTVTIYDTVRIVRTLKTDQHIRHRQPIRFGLALRYRIDNRWSLESGLSYTRLVSDITTITEGQATVAEQRLNYIGLPLNVGYQLWENRHFGLYATAGGTIEKMLDASPWQFSLNGAAGAEYKLTNRFSLYAEPGIGYYFPNASTTPTIYQYHPLNFNLSFGLRFNL